MRFDVMGARSGKCYVCGKPTHLLIHAECGKQSEAIRKASGEAKASAKQHERSRKNYQRGVVPPFAKL